MSTSPVSRSHQPATASMQPISASAQVSSYRETNPYALSSISSYRRPQGLCAWIGRFLSSIWQCIKACFVEEPPSRIKDLHEIRQYIHDNYPNFTIDPSFPCNYVMVNSVNYSGHKDCNFGVLGDIRPDEMFDNAFRDLDVLIDEDRWRPYGRFSVNSFLIGKRNNGTFSLKHVDYRLTFSNGKVTRSMGSRELSYVRPDRILSMVNAFIPERCRGNIAELIQNANPVNQR